MTESDAAITNPEHTEQPEQPEQPQQPEALREAMNRVRHEVGKAVVGQDGAVTGLLAFHGAIERDDARAGVHVDLDGAEVRVLRQARVHLGGDTGIVHKGGCVGRGVA